MSSAGKGLDASLRRNIDSQLDRLMKQLVDLEEYRTEMDADEHEQMKRETMEQLSEFHQSLERLIGGDVTLIDELSAMKMAIRAAISEAFRTPEITALFARKQPALLRLKLVELDRDHKAGKVPIQPYKDRRVEILVALKKLREPLSPDEERFLVDNSTKELLAKFDLVSSESEVSDKLVSSIESTK